MTVGYQVLKGLCLSYSTLAESFLFSSRIIHISVVGSKPGMVDPF